MRGAAHISGIRMGKSLKAKKALKVWLEAKKKRSQERRQKVEEAKKKYPQSWRKLKI